MIYLDCRFQYLFGRTVHRQPIRGPHIYLSIITLEPLGHLGLRIDGLDSVLTPSVPHFELHSHIISYTVDRSAQLTQDFHSTCLSPSAHISSS